MCRPVACSTVFTSSCGPPPSGPPPFPYAELIFATPKPGMLTSESRGMLDQRGGPAPGVQDHDRVGELAGLVAGGVLLALRLGELLTAVRADDQPVGALRRRGAGRGQRVGAAEREVDVDGEADDEHEQHEQHRADAPPPARRAPRRGTGAVDRGGRRAAAGTSWRGAALPGRRGAPAAAAASSAGARRRAAARCAAAADPPPCPGVAPGRGRHVGRGRHRSCAPSRHTFGARRGYDGPAWTRTNRSPLRFRGARDLRKRPAPGRRTRCSRRWGRGGRCCCRCRGRDR